MTKKVIKNRKSKYLPEIPKEEPKVKVIKAPKVKDPEKEIEGESLQQMSPEMIAKLTPEQLATLVEDFSRRDPYKIKGTDSRFVYRFINRKEDKLDRQTMRGWVIVTGPEAIKIAKETKVQLRQGQIIVGDSVLARMPKELGEAIKLRNKKLSDRMIGESSNTLRRDMGSKYSRNVEETLKHRSMGGREVTVI